MFFGNGTTHFTRPKMIMFSSPGSGANFLIAPLSFSEIAKKKNKSCDFLPLAVYMYETHRHMKTQVAKCEERHQGKSGHWQRSAHNSSNVSVVSFFRQYDSASAIFCNDNMRLGCNRRKIDRTASPTASLAYMPTQPSRIIREPAGYGTDLKLSRTGHHISRIKSSFQLFCTLVEI